MLSGLVVAEAGPPTAGLTGHIPQVIVEMYACAKTLGSVPFLYVIHLPK